MIETKGAYTVAQQAVADRLFEILTPAQWLMIADELRKASASGDGGMRIEVKGGRVVLEPYPRIDLGCVEGEK